MSSEATGYWPKKTFDEVIRFSLRNISCADLHPTKFKDNEKRDIFLKAFEDQPFFSVKAEDFSSIPALALKPSFKSSTKYCFIFFQPQVLTIQITNSDVEILKKPFSYKDIVLDIREFEKELLKQLTEIATKP